MKRSTKKHLRGVTLVEVLVAVGVIALSVVIMTQALLILNRNSSLARVRNLAKAMALSRVQEVAALNFVPLGTPPVIPTLLTNGVTTENVELGDPSAGIGRLPAVLRWTVAEAGTDSIRSVRCRVEYTYLGRAQNYEVLTFRSPD